MVAARNEIVRAEFTNDCGEKWRVSIDPRRQIGFLSGDETGEDIEIRDNRICADLILSADEFRWLAGVWREATGFELEMPAMLRLAELLADMNGTMG